MTKSYPLNHHATPMYATVETEYLDKLHQVKATADIIGADRLKKISDAYVAAVVKHPKFCDVMTKAPEVAVMNALNIYRASNDNTEVYSAEEILFEEVYEALEQYQNGDIEKCKEELYQVVAVAIRMINFVEDKQNA